MAGEFTISKDVELPASQNEVWAAVTTRAGLTAWFMPMDVGPGPDGRPPTGPGVVWEPPVRFTIRTPPDVAGDSHVFTYSIDPMADGSSVLHFVHSGVGSEAEHSSTRNGWDMYFHTLHQYLRYFPGRPASYVTAEGPPSSKDPHRWADLLAALELDPEPADRSPVCFIQDGLPEIIGVVDYLGPGFLGIRTSDAMYRFHGRSRLGLPVAVGHHLFAPALGAQAPEAVEAAAAWKAWLVAVFG